MGYTTEFFGSVELDKPLDAAHLAYLRQFAYIRHMDRDPEEASKSPDPLRIASGLPIGERGAYYVGQDQDDCGQNTEGGVVDPDSCGLAPSFWCQWTPTDDGTSIVWDEGEKFYSYVEWMVFLIEHFLKPWGYVANGEIEWRGEDDSDRGAIVVEDNVVFVQFFATVREDRKRVSPVEEAA